MMMRSVSVHQAPMTEDILGAGCYLKKRPSVASTGSCFSRRCLGDLSSCNSQGNHKVVFTEILYSFTIPMFPVAWRVWFQPSFSSTMTSGDTCLVLQQRRTAEAGDYRRINHNFAKMIQEADDRL